MKKAILGVFTAVMVLSAGTMSVCAAGCDTRHHHTDTVCDNADRICYYVDADEDGICDICDAAHGVCPNGDGECFIDADGDNVCDNCNAYHSCRSTDNNRGCQSRSTERTAGGSHHRHRCHR
ncbi:MAG: hypothetical protein K2J60_00535 [Acetatifactor sp.]|nr:hypothetical protein [Acetatifactor sp.]